MSAPASWPETFAQLVIKRTLARCGTDTGKLRKAIADLVNRDLTGERPETRDALERVIAALRKRVSESELPLPERAP